MTLSKLEQLYREVRQLSLQERTWLAEGHQRRHAGTDRIRQPAAATGRCIVHIIRLIRWLIIGHVQSLIRWLIIPFTIKSVRSLVVPFIVG